MAIHAAYLRGTDITFTKPSAYRGSSTITAWPTKILSSGSLSSYTPSVVARPHPARVCHKYRKLGQGMFPKITQRSPRQPRRHGLLMHQPRWPRCCLQGCRLEHWKIVGPQRIKPGAVSANCKLSFKREVEAMLELKHVSACASHIVPLFIWQVNLHNLLRAEHCVHCEGFQDFAIGSTFKILYRLYDGSVRQLMANHKWWQGPLSEP